MSHSPTREMHWLNLLILFVLFAGHAELLAMLVNRLHAVPVHRRTLRKVRMLHDVLLVAVPAAAVWFVGLNGASVLRGGRWSEVEPGWLVYFAVCGVGSLALAGCMLRWAFLRVPHVQASNHTWTVDVARRLGRKPIGDGPHRLLARIPGNEVFRVDVSEKQYRLPRLPREWDGLSILHLTDFHMMGTIDRPYYEQVVEIGASMNADLVVFTGDLLDRLAMIDWLPATLGKLEAPLGRYFILGNHDWDLDPEVIRTAVKTLGWRDVAGQTVEIEHRGHQLILGGTERPWMGEHPDFRSAPREAFRLLLSHTPDHLAYAQNQNVDLMLSGHNHGGQVVLPVIGPVYAPSRFGVRHAAGVFWHDPTLLYVSRGLSGQHPLRWNCPPELTKLILCAE